MTAEVQRLVRLQVDAAQALTSLRQMRQTSAEAAKAIQQTGNATANTAKQMQGVVVPFRQTAEAMQRLNSVSGRSTAALRNVGFQVQDMAVQLGLGTSAIVVMTQQLPQLLGGFGTFAVVAGAAVAVIGALALNFEIGGTAVEGFKAAVTSSLATLREFGSTLADAGVTVGRVTAYLAAMGVAFAIGPIISGATAAVLGLVAAFTSLRAILLRLGFTAIVVALGEIIYQTVQAVRGFGGMGAAWEAFSRLMVRAGDGVRSILAGIGDAVYALLESTKAYAAGVANSVIDVFEKMYTGVAFVVNKIIRVISPLARLTNFGIPENLTIPGKDALTGIQGEAGDRAGAYASNSASMIGAGVAEIKAAASEFIKARDAGLEAADAAFTFGRAMGDTGGGGTAGGGESVASGARKAVEDLVKFEEELRKAHSEAVNLSNDMRRAQVAAAEFGTSLDVETQVATWTRLAQEAGYTADAIARGADEARRLAVETEAAVAQTAAMTGGGESGLSNYFKDLQDLSKSVQDSLVGSLTDFSIAASEGKASFADFAESVRKDVQRLVTEFAIRQLVGLLFAPLDGALAAAAGGGLFGGGGRSMPVRAFAKGGIIDTPTLFPYANGVGLMGEAGAEAILPVNRHRILTPDRRPNLTPLWWRRLWACGQRGALSKLRRRRCVMSTVGLWARG